MKQIFTISLATLILYSCKSGPKDLSEYMVDISEFKINNKILKDGDYIEILGSSGNLTKEHEIDFYNLVVVKSVETGDTINVLVTNFYQADLNNPRTRFMSNSSSAGKLMEQASNFEELDGKNIKDLKAKSFSKVFYDSEFIQVNVRKYPTITGNLGDYTIQGDFSEVK
jgi:translation elongation factor P/translation initiation factor 5A